MPEQNVEFKFVFFIGKQTGFTEECPLKGECTRAVNNMVIQPIKHLNWTVTAQPHAQGQPGLPTVWNVGGRSEQIKLCIVDYARGNILRQRKSRPRY